MIDPTTRTPASYRLARFFLRGRAWRWYLDRLVSTEHRWNRSASPGASAAPPLTAPRAGVRELDLLEPRRNNGRMTEAGRKAAQKSVRAAIKNHDKRSRFQTPSRCGTCGGNNTNEKGVCDACVSFQRSLNPNYVGPMTGDGRYYKTGDVVRASALHDHMQNRLTAVKSIEQGGIIVTYADPPPAPVGVLAKHLPQLGPSCKCVQCMYPERLLD